eukprot:7386225-Prymnesium_polylepis.1
MGWLVLGMQADAAAAARRLLPGAQRAALARGRRAVVANQRQASGSATSGPRSRRPSTASRASVCQIDGAVAMCGGTAFETHLSAETTRARNALYTTWPMYVQALLSEVGEGSRHGQ